MIVDSSIGVSEGTIVDVSEGVTVNVSESTIVDVSEGVTVNVSEGIIADVAVGSFGWEENKVIMKWASTERIKIAIVSPIAISNAARKGFLRIEPFSVVPILHSTASPPVYGCDFKNRLFGFFGGDDLSLSTQLRVRILS
jgi:hypothetical protein